MVCSACGEEGHNSRTCPPMPIETEEDKAKRGQRDSPRTPAKEQLPGISTTARISSPLQDMEGGPDGTQKPRLPSERHAPPLPMGGSVEPTPQTADEKLDEIMAMMEKVAVAKSRSSQDTVINVTRYGNVMASRGSVIPLFIRQIRNEEPITITDPNMTRFMMTLDDAVDLVLFAFEHAEAGEVVVQKAPAATIQILAKALTHLLGVPDHPIHIIGTRHGEKLYEALLSREEMVAAHDLGDYYRVPPDLRDLNYGKYVERGEVKISDASEYHSHNTTRLNLKETQMLLLKLRSMDAIVRGEQVEIEE